MDDDMRTPIRPRSVKTTDQLWDDMHEVVRRRRTSISALLVAHMTELTAEIRAEREAQA